MCDAYLGYIQYFTKKREVLMNQSHSDLGYFPPKSNFVGMDRARGIVVEDGSWEDNVKAGSTEDIKDQSRDTTRDVVRRVIDDPRALCLTCCTQAFCNRLEDCGSGQTPSWSATQTISPTPVSVQPVTGTTISGQSVISPQFPVSAVTSASPSAFVVPTSQIQPSSSLSLTPLTQSSPHSSKQPINSQTISPSLQLPSIGTSFSSMSHQSSLPTLSPSSALSSTPTGPMPSSLLSTTPALSLQGSASSQLSPPSQVSSATTFLSPTPFFSPHSVSPLVTASINPAVPTPGLSSSLSILPTTSLASFTPASIYVTSQVTAVVSSNGTSNASSLTTPSTPQLGQNLTTPASSSRSSPAGVSGSTSTGNISPQNPIPTVYIEGVWCFNCHGPLCGYSGYQQPVKCGQATPFCLTTYIAEGGQALITKSCTDFSICKSKWYETSSDNSNCDNLSVQPGQRKECNYCCVKDYCNEQTIPKVDSLFDPALFPGISKRDIDAGK
ncbi:hypothetical protein PoB_001484100 [Plakobranchus ocellatus]|uniref:Uncharacterized protein n=1 Tax=Plakobranchus ocellatus TaxID=259542 RepID=A0AAV3YXV2_9GAST|nr:hypothetical protein PoB_001484100 [Plakobranchus ocellatus]